MARDDQEEDPLPRLGPRVVLRRLRLADLESFQAYRHDSEVGLYQGWSPLSDEEAEAFLESMHSIALFKPGEWFQVGIADRVTDALLGDIGICVGAEGASAEIGFSLRAESQGLGLAGEAVSGAMALVFEQTAVAEVLGVTDARNIRSIRLMERVGMRRVRAVQAIFRGAPCLEFVYSISRVSAGC